MTFPPSDRPQAMGYKNHKAMVQTPTIKYVRETSGPNTTACLRAVQVTVHATQTKATQPKAKKAHWSKHQHQGVK